jgi:hypothetical protein
LKMHDARLRRREQWKQFYATRIKPRVEVVKAKVKSVAEKRFHWKRSHTQPIHIQKESIAPLETATQHTAQHIDLNGWELVDVGFGFKVWIHRGVNRVNPERHELQPGMYPGGSHVEGWSPLRDRTLWKEREVTKTQERLALLPEWYLSIRSQAAVWLEIMRRIQPYIVFAGIRLPFPVYSFAALLVLIATAPLIPGPAIYNVLLAPILLFGGGIQWLDRAVAFSQPLITWPLVNTYNAIVWTAQHVANALTLGMFKLSRKLNYYPMFNKKEKIAQ